MRAADEGPRRENRRRVSARRGGKSPAYEDWFKDDLYEKAKEVGIEGRSKMTKQELIDALRRH
ncbi:MAG: Rho termination factor N-terminal domain-containing protein [Planctomycetales bacterium]